MKHNHIRITIVLLCLSALLTACANTGSSPKQPTQNPNAQNEEPSVTVEEVVDKETLELTETLVDEFFAFECNNKVSYDPNNSDHVAAKECFRTSFYSAHRIGDYHLCSWEYMVMEATNSVRYGDYLFETMNIMSPSELGLYLYKDGSFLTVENALEQELVTPKQLYDVLVSDIKYRVEVKYAEQDPNTCVSSEQNEEPSVTSEEVVDKETLELTETLVDEFFAFEYNNKVSYDPNDFEHVAAKECFRTSFYSAHRIGDYHLCSWVYMAMEATNSVRYGDYLFETMEIMAPSELGLYLYKDGSFLTVERALEQELVTPKQLYDILVSDIKYGVEVKYAE